MYTFDRTFDSRITELTLKDKTYNNFECEIHFDFMCKIKNLAYPGRKTFVAKTFEDLVADIDSYMKEEHKYFEII